MSFLFELGLLLLGAKLLGELAERLQLPSILGYIAAGFLLGPIHGIVHPSAEIAVFGQLGALLLLFVAGIKEIRLEDIMNKKLATFSVAFLGYLFPFLAVFYIGAHIDAVLPGVSLSLNEILIMAAALSISSVVTTVKTLIELNKLNTAGVRVLLGASIIDSFFGLFAFTLIMTLATTPFFNLSRVVGVTALTTAFFMIFYLAEKALPKIISKSRFLEVEEAQFTVVFVIMLGLVWMAEAIGLNGVIGAFFAGVIVSKTKMSESIFYEKIASLTYGIFVPIFFAWVGLMVVPMYNDAIWLLLGAIAAANVLGAYVGARFGNLKEDDAILVGVGMIPRGGIDLVVIAAAKSLGVLEGTTGNIVFSMVVIVVAASIVLTPILIHALFNPNKQYS